jgi:hypothetical protein
MLNTSTVNLTLFKSEQQFIIALKMANVPRSPLQSPAAMARGLPQQAIRPWAFRVMKGRFGLADPCWARLFEDAGFLIAIICGLAIPFGHKFKVTATSMILVSGFAIIIALIVNYFANDCIFDGGADDYLGLLTLPPAYIAVALTSQIIRFIIDKVTGPIQKGRPFQSGCEERQPF